VGGSEEDMVLVRRLFPMESSGLAGPIIWPDNEGPVWSGLTLGHSGLGASLAPLYSNHITCHRSGRHHIDNLLTERLRQLLSL
jgi:hypothetical protein